MDSSGKLWASIDINRRREWDLFSYLTPFAHVNADSLDFVSAYIVI